MRVYIVDMDGYYIAYQDCQPSPLEPGKFLMPRSGSYTDKEPTLSAGKWPRLVAGKWTYIDDKRGTDIWDTATAQKQKCRHYQIPDGYTDKEPGVDDTWKGTGWVVDSAKQSARIAAEETRARETLISAKMRAMAEDALKVEGKR